MAFWNSIRLVVCLVSVASSQVRAADDTGEKIVYGVDNRQDVYELPGSDMWVNIAKQSIVAVKANPGLAYSSVNADIDNYLNAFPDANRLGVQEDLCTDQKFYYDPKFTSCSGTLIAPDRILTAGHCFTGAECIGQYMLFNYYATGRDVNGKPTFPQITGDDLYTCQAVYTVLDATTRMDYAVVHLDRSVVGHTPVTMSTYSVPLALSDPVSLIGFPSGIPAKIDTGGVVLRPNMFSMTYFVASTDTFHGNSGSGVFAANGTLVGILARGGDDYVTRASENCNEVNVVTNASPTCGCGEEITYAYHANDVIDCKTDSDCTAQTLYKSTQCRRRCSTSSTLCTGFCLPSSEIGAITCNSVVNGNTYTALTSVGGAGGDHLYTLTLSEPVTVTASVCDVTWGGFAVIYSTSNTLLKNCTSDCGCSSSSGSRVSMALSAGTYKVGIDSDAATKAGAYSLSLTCGPPPSPTSSPTSSVSPTQSRSASITPTSSPTPRPVFAISGTLGCGYTVNGSTVNSTNQIGNPSGERVYSFSVVDTDYKLTFNTCLSNFDTYLRIWDSQFDREIALCDDCGDCGSRAVLSTVLNPGDYALMIEGSGADEGDYTINLQCSTKRCVDSTVCDYISGCSEDFYSLCPVTCNTCIGSSASPSPSAVISGAPRIATVIVVAAALVSALLL